MRTGSLWGPSTHISYQKRNKWLRILKISCHLQSHRKSKNSSSQRRERIIEKIEDLDERNQCFGGQTVKSKPVLKRFWESLWIRGIKIIWWQPNWEIKKKLFVVFAWSFRKQKRFDYWWIIVEENACLEEIASAGEGEMSACPREVSSIIGRSQAKAAAVRQAETA